MKPLEIKEMLKVYRMTGKACKKAYTETPRTEINTRRFLLDALFLHMHKKDFDIQSVKVSYKKGCYAFLAFSTKNMYLTSNSPIRNLLIKSLNEQVVYIDAKRKRVRVIIIYRIAYDGEEKKRTKKDKRDLK